MIEKHTILHREQLSAEVFLLRVQAALIAEERRPGQFIMLSLDLEYGERIPLTIADADVREGSITLIFQRVGQCTAALADLKVGDEIPILVGPLGQPTHIERFGTVVCVGGGIGVAPLYPIIAAFMPAMIGYSGARNRELILLEDRVRALSDELIVCTDDGSYGRKALVTEPLTEVCQRQPKPDLVVVIGPAIMMKFCAQATRPFAVRTLVSLNSVMVDGTGMCGGCRVSVGGKTKFVCVDGPEFDGHAVDFDELMKRQQAYRGDEKAAMTRWLDARHACTIAEQAREKLAACRT
ncbi:MAG: sulfide/dihydroorotate dehydrogenase-like FAD/NAD-binding protein [Hyphomicrobiales bacterium]|nr:MAG: sulfide/dihydroorotate dehydrogenase-like FAD/NAD-binding protein [Hyphomicrobiales bacterium]